MKNPIYISILLVLALPPLHSFSQKKAPPFLAVTGAWTDSVMNSLSPDERIAQLFMVAAYSNRDSVHMRYIARLVGEYKIGGLIFFQGGPARQAHLTNEYQCVAKTPLLISIDAEWGLAMRLDSTIQFPRQMTLGAIQNDSLIYNMGKEIARQCKRIGIHVNLAPVADVNNNPLNPVIGVRSFGEDMKLVTKKSAMYMKGMQDAGVLACLKHFPGHGDTDKDSHKTLPVISHSRKRLDSLELYPFKELIGQGAGSVMVAHLFIPALDTTSNIATTLSPNVVNNLLKKELGFKGLVFTDALNMKGVSQFYPPGRVDVKALLAGNDVLLFSEDVPTAITEIKKAMERGEIMQAEIDERCRKILLAKEWTGLNHYQPVRTDSVWYDLNHPLAVLLNRKLTEHSITVLSNKRNTIPVRGIDKLKIASLSLGLKEITAFQERLDFYAPITHFSISRTATKLQMDSLLKKLKLFNLVIIAVNNTTNSPQKDFGITLQMQSIIKSLAGKTKLIVNFFSNPYAVSKFPGLEKVDAVMVSYEYTPLFQDISAQVIFGGVSARGKLPVTANKFFKKGTGLRTLPPSRFSYTLPEDAGMSSAILNKIDTIAEYGIKQRAYPGCQVFVAKDGKVVFYKAYGYHTYENKTAVKVQDIYDIASVTKIVSSTAAMMKLVEQKKIGLDDYLCHHLPVVEGTNKQSIILREMLSHHAGLQPYIYFWQKTMKRGEYLPGIYSAVKSKQYSLKVTENLYMNIAYRDTIFKTVIESEIKDPQKYKYSDLGYFFLQKIIETKTEKPLDEYVKTTFYDPLGLPTMRYKPREKFKLERIVPTELDTKFRKQLVHGYVHDQAAAMLGGVGGHAGVFSNANDVGVMMQLFMQKGEYGGKRYIDSTVVNEFTKCQYCVDGNRRGLGFDRPLNGPGKDGPVCECVSYLSYGHSGFTGTLTWVDPESGLVYVFLSNRVHPDADRNTLAKLNIRTQIQRVIYDSMGKGNSLTVNR